MRSAIVVAGGSSERFGDREKALAPYDGDPMLARVARAVAPTVDDLVINCRADQRPDFEFALDRASLSLARSQVRFAVDDRPDRGPVAGLRRGLEVAAHDRAVVVPCDLPLLESAFVARLFEAHASERPDAVVPRCDGYRQPLCAVYDASAARRACETVLESDRRRMADVLDELEVAELAESRIEAWTEPHRLRAVDTPAALRRLRDGRRLLERTEQ